MLWAQFIAVAAVILFAGANLSKYGDVIAEKTGMGRTLGRRGSNCIVLVIGAAAYLPSLGERIAEVTGLGGTFVSTTFIALATTLPELVVSISALRIDAADLVW